MKCQEKGCLGNVNPEIAVSLRVDCQRFNDACPCDTCGRLHWPGGEAVFNRQGNRAFYREQAIVLLDAAGATSKL